MSEPAVLASGIQLDGRYRAIPGFTEGAYMGDAHPFLVRSGDTLLDFYTSTGSTYGYTMIPFNYTVIAAHYVLTQVLDGAQDLLNIGTVADPDAFIDDYAIATSVSASVLTNITGSLVAANVNGNAGDIIQFSTGGGATSTGKGVATLVIIPRL